LQDWEDGKRAHLELSELAAAQYDELYEAANFATGSYMQYELDRLQAASRMSPDRRVALDLGCGTGRHSFELARAFDQVYGYDLSPAMIEVCEQNKYRRGAGNVSFEVADVEEGLRQLPDSFASLISCSFGMASFVENIDDLLRTVRRLLVPGGVVACSWYNETALVNQLDLEWRPALAARIVPGQRLLRVDFPGRQLDISAVAYSVAFIRERLERNFHHVEVATYPTLTALLPQSVFQHERARELCRHVDGILADNLQIGAGPYIFAICKAHDRRKSARQQAIGYHRVLELFETHRIEAKFISHAPVRNMEDVQRELPQISPSSMVKSILVARQRPDGDRRADKLFLFAIPADRRLDFAKVAKLLQAPRANVHLATAEQLEERTGFDIGAIPPFGMPRSVPIYVDKSLADQRELWTGTGKSTESMRLTIEELRQLSTFSVADAVQS
jgi:prolyl-tRNA editing enzyme YbaK/EbsC (Cys-tRNA(Pro) deacylase)/ubiquinone/menaquinone biosynthesis C-methylase UbiE